MIKKFLLIIILLFPSLANSGVYEDATCRVVTVTDCTTSPSSNNYRYTGFGVHSTGQIYLTGQVYQGATANITVCTIKSYFWRDPPYTWTVIYSQVQIRYLAGTELNVEFATDQVLVDSLPAQCPAPPDPCSQKNLEAIIYCGGSSSNVDAINGLDSEGCPTQCICDPNPSISSFYERGTTQAIIGMNFCREGCQGKVVEIENFDSYFPQSNEKCQQEGWNDYCVPWSKISLESQGMPCIGPGIEPVPYIPDPPVLPPPPGCMQQEANCMVECGSPYLVEQFICDEDTGESQCECKPMQDCAEQETACNNSCNGIENRATFECHMESGLPVLDECTCMAPPNDKTCQDYTDNCIAACGGAENVAYFECKEGPYGPWVTQKCQCGHPPNTCPPGRICDRDGYCQPGESPTSADCITDNDKDGCPDGTICANDGKCQPGESKDSYDCGGNNDGNTGNDPGGPGAGEGTGVRPCPAGQVCSGDGICQPGESPTAVDCAGPGGTPDPGEEGEAGQVGSENGLCPEGSICQGDGVCQPAEPSTAVDCAGLNYTATRFNQMAAAIKGSALFRLTDGMDVPSGGNSVKIVSLGKWGGSNDHTENFDFAKFAVIFAILNGVLSVMAIWAGIKIITLKGGA